MFVAVEKKKRKNPINKKSNFTKQDLLKMYLTKDLLNVNKKGTTNKLKKAIYAYRETHSNRPSPSQQAKLCKNLILLGNDMNYYISLPNKKNVYQWKRYKFMTEAKNAEEFYQQEKPKKLKYNRKSLLANIKKVKKDLAKENVFLIFVPWKNVYNFIDDAEEDVIEIHVPKLLKKKPKLLNSFIDNPFKSEVSYIYFTDHRLYWSCFDDGKLHLHHNINNKKAEKVQSVFKKYFGSRFKWNGKANKSILLKLKKNK